MSITIKTTTEIKAVANFIAQPILQKIKSGKRVLWFVTGGSSVPVAVEAAKIISKELNEIKGQEIYLTVTLTDERYVPVDHPDSNWHQLQEAGFNFPQAKLIPVLRGENRAVTSEQFNNILEKELAEAQFKIGLFGMGKDGHTAGILPESGAVNADKLAYDYATEIFERITITPKVIEALDEIILFAKGEDKWPMIENLNKEIDISKQPAQILKKVPILTIFTDYNGKQ